MNDTKLDNRPLSPSAEAAARRQFLKAAASLATLAASAGVSLEVLAQTATPAPKSSGTAKPASSGLGGLVKSVTGNPKVTQALVDVLKDALVTKDVKASIAKVAKGVVFPEKESNLLNSMSASDLTGVAKLKDGLGGLDAGTAVGVVKGLFGV